VSRWRALQRFAISEQVPARGRRRSSGYLAFEAIVRGPCRLRSVPVRSAPLRSGSLDFPAPSSTFTVSGVALEVFRRVAPLRPPFRLGSAGLLPGLRPRSAPRLGSVGLSRGERVSGRSASPGLSPLPSTWPAGVHSRCALRRARRFGVGGSTSAVPFRPRRFARPRRLAPPAGSRACCVPLPIWVHRVSAPTDSFRGSREGLRVRLGRRMPRGASTPRRSSLDPSRPASPRPLAPMAFGRRSRVALTFEALLRNPGL